jgi:hypothetical protein
VRKLLIASGVIERVRGPAGTFQYRFLRKDVPGERPLDSWLAACQAALSSPVDFFPDDRRLNLAYSVCYQLSRTDSPFILPMQKLAKFLGVKQTTVRVMLGVLVREGGNRGVGRRRFCFIPRI